MKKRLIYTLALLTLSIGYGSAQSEKTTSAKLDEAIVFFGGAELMHTASAQLDKGSNEVYIEGLSNQIDINSLKVKASNGAVVSSFEFSANYLTEDKRLSTASRKLQDSLTYYQHKLEVLNGDIEINNNMISMVKKGSESIASGSDKAPGNVTQLTNSVEFYRKQSQALYKEAREYKDQQQKMVKHIQGLNAQLNQEKLKNDRTTGRLKINLTAPYATNGKFTLSYYTTAATWANYYDIVIESTDKPVKIISKAAVRQTTGLDWDKIKLSLSTNQPSKGMKAPILSPWFLSNNYTRIASGGVDNRQTDYYLKMAAPMALQESKMDILTETAETAAPMYLVDGELVNADIFSTIDNALIKNQQYIDAGKASSVYGFNSPGGLYVVDMKSEMDDFVTVNDKDINQVFSIDLPYTISGNGKVQNIDLKSQTADAEYIYYAAPKLSQEVFLMAQVKDWQKLNLLSGTAKVTYDGTYLGETTIDTKSVKKELELSLGVDKRIAIKREKMQDYSSSNFLGNDTKQDFAYKITLQNNQSKKIKLKLEDQYPISTQKNIQIELSKMTTEWTKNNEEKGFITWEVDLTPAQSKEFTMRYSVKYPKGSNLNL